MLRKRAWFQFKDTNIAIILERWSLSPILLVNSEGYPVGPGDMAKPRVDIPSLEAPFFEVLPKIMIISKN